uniref:Uncharacterized protein n=1 Tax=Arundo donax TaxID=35708 RepID=A0A0A9DMB6_ARUDO
MASCSAGLSTSAAFASSGAAGTASSPTTCTESSTIASRSPPLASPLAALASPAPSNSTTTASRRPSHPQPCSSVSGTKKLSIAVASSSESGVNRPVSSSKPPSSPSESGAYRMPSQVTRNPPRPRLIAPLGPKHHRRAQMPLLRLGIELLLRFVRQIRSLQCQIEPSRWGIEVMLRLPPPPPLNPPRIRLARPRLESLRRRVPLLQRVLPPVGLMLPMRRG